jgi:hypothetical protein
MNTLDIPTIYLTAIQFPSAILQQTHKTFAENCGILPDLPYLCYTKNCTTECTEVAYAIPAAGIFKNEVDMAFNLNGIKNIYALELRGIPYFKDQQFCYIYSNIYATSFQYV